MSISGQGDSSGHLDGSAFCYPPPFQVDTYIRFHRFWLETSRLAAFSSNGVALLAPHKRGSRDIVTEAWRRRRKHRGARVVLELLTAPVYMDSTILRSREVSSYQRQLAFAARGSAMASKNAYCCITWRVGAAQSISNPLPYENRFYWTRGFFFESRICERQKIFGAWHNVECFSVRSPDCVKYNCDFFSYWLAYELPTLLSVLSPVMLDSYGGVAMHGSAADQTRIWTSFLTGEAFMAGCSSS